MKKKVTIVVCSVLLAAVLAFGVVPVAADDGPSQSPPAAQQAHKGQILKRLLAIQDEAKVDALLAQAVSSGRITEEQAARAKDFWTAHHTQYIKTRIVERLLRVQDEAKLDAALAQAVASGRITDEQAGRIKALWVELHSR